MAPFILAHHCNIAKITTTMTTLPMVSSMTIQASSFPRDNDESAIIETSRADLSAMMLSWKSNPQINIMTTLHEQQQTNPSELPKISVQPIATATPGGTSGDIAVSDMVGEEEFHDTGNVDVQLAQLTSSHTAALIDLVKKKTAGGPFVDTLPRTNSFAITPVTSPRPEKLPDKRKGKKDNKTANKKDKAAVVTEGKKEKQGDNKPPKSAKKKVKSSAKSITSIPTHGSVKVEMMPQCDASHVEGITDRDRVIQEAMALCNGCGFSFMNTSAMENSSLGDDADAEYASFCDQITEAKRQLLEIDEAMTSTDTARDTSQRNCSDEGTKLSLYSTICSICTLLNHRKEAGIYMQKYVEAAEASNLPEYQAIGVRLQLDFEEWMSAPTLSQMVSSQKLNRLQGVLQMTKKYFFYAEKAQTVNADLYFDAWKRLVNVYTEISSLPDTPGAPKPPFVEVLEENLALLTADEVEANEKNDMDWLKRYSRIRAKVVMGKMLSSLQSFVETSQKKLVDLGA